MIRVDTSQFQNYPAYKHNLEPLDFYQVKDNLYLVCRAGDDPKNYIQTGTMEYINGWLYGAVQTACGQLRKRTGDYPELSNYNDEHKWDLDLFREANKGDDNTPEEDLDDYEVIFEVNDDRYYCYIFAVNMNEALGLFFKAHPHVTYEMIVDHIEV